MPHPSGLQFLLRNQLIILWEFPCILLVAFLWLQFFWFFVAIFSFSLIFVNFIIMCFSIFFLEFIQPKTLYFLDLGDCFFADVREIFSYYLFKYFLRFFLSLLLCWDPKNTNVGIFNVVPRSQTIFISFHSFSFLLFHGSDFHTLSPTHFSSA